MEEFNVQDSELLYIKAKDIVEVLTELYEDKELLKWCYIDKHGNIGELQKEELGEVLLQIEGVKELSEIYDFILNILVRNLPYEVHLLF